jgi:hypothetical protein
VLPLDDELPQAARLTAMAATAAAPAVYLNQAARDLLLLCNIALLHYYIDVMLGA